MNSIQDDKKLYRYTRLLSVVLFCGFVALNSALANSVQIEISRIGDATHLEFQGQSNWLYDVRRDDNNQLVILVPPLNDKSILTLQTWSCPFIKEVKVNKNGPDGRHEVQMALTSSDVESFDYQTDSPSNLIFDFYRQASPEPVKTVVAPAKNTKAVSAGKKVSKLPEKMTPSEYQKIDRSPAGTETLAVEPPGPGPSPTPTDPVEDTVNIDYARGVFDGSDPNFDRFRIKNYQIKEKSIIVSRQNIYLEFPMLALKSNRFADMMSENPIYEIKPEETQENKEARLLHTLYKNNRPASFLETYDYFLKKYPNTKYGEIIRNMAVEVHIGLFKRDGDPVNYNSFQSIIKYLSETYPDSILTERNRLLQTYAYLDRGQAMESLREIQLFEKIHPKSEETERLKFAKAESLVGLAKLDDALEIYKKLQVNAKDSRNAVEATYREGDIYFLKKDYKKALAAYVTAQNKYPKHVVAYSNAQYNIAESQFWLGQHKAGLDAYIQFLQNFPAHDYGGFALTRIGELLQILGGEQRKYMGAFLEAYFRYPNSAGADVARIRMLAQGLRTMKEREKKRAIDEIDTLKLKTQLPRFQEFATLMKADGLSGREDYRESLDLLVGYFQAHPTTANVNIFRGRILRNISDIMYKQIASNNYLDALNFYGHFSKTWLKNTNRIDTRYFQARAYENAGVFGEAEKLYAQIKTTLESIRGTNEEKERMVNERLPSSDQVNLRLAAIATAQRQDQRAHQHLSRVRNNITEDEQIEKVQLSALVAENLGDYKKASAELEAILKTWRGDQSSGLLLPVHLKVAALNIKLKNYKKVEEHLQNIDKAKESAVPSTDDIWASALEVRGDLFAARGENLAAAEAYGRLLEAYESSRPLSAIRFKTGKILFDEGDIKGAEKVWGAFTGQSGDYYRRLAMEKLAQAEWQDTYKKYIDRIPAAEGMK